MKENTDTINGDKSDIIKSSIININIYNNENINY